MTGIANQSVDDIDFSDIEAKCVRLLRKNSANTIVLDIKCNTMMDSTMSSSLTVFLLSIGQS